jgi:tetratricopeptide (TPR) repeat protein
MNRRVRRAAQNSKETPRDAAIPATLSTAGFVHVQAGESPDARTSSDKARSIEPNHQHDLYLAGLAAMRAGQHDHAVDWLVRAIRHTPRVEYVSALGTALQRQGRFEEALKAPDKAASLQPDNALHWKDLGAVLIDLGRTDKALLSLRQALKLSPQYADAANLSGLIHHRKGHNVEALESFNISLEGQPNQADALPPCGFCCHTGRTIGGSSTAQIHLGTRPARLFRQDERRDHDSVIDRVRSELAIQAAAFRGSAVMSY